MTQMNAMQSQMKENESEKKKKFQQSEDIQKQSVPTKYPSDYCITITAWILLTVGLCILAATFLLYIQRAGKNEKDYDDYYSDKIDVNDDGADVVDNIEVFLDFNKSTRAIDETIFGKHNVSFIGCEQKFCKVVCTEAADIYNDLYDVLNLDTSCTSVDVLLIRQQSFPRDILKNAWLPVSNSLREVIISSSDVKFIRNAAFNSPIFSTTFLLTWHDLQLVKVEGGALLGLHALKYLTIHTELESLDRAFFQPVQTTLTHLKLNAGLLITDDQDVFGISCMNKLEYLDISDNVFNVSISKQMFYGTPNLKYLHIMNGQITAIESDAFEELAGKLYLLNLSHNLLTTLHAEVILPLLAANTNSFVSLTDNGWVCDCALQAFTQAYKSHRSQFIDALYCKAPHELYGTFMVDLNLEDLGCQSEWVTMPVSEPETTIGTEIKNGSNQNYGPRSTTPKPTTLTTASATNTFEGTTRPMNGDNNSAEASSSQESRLFKMRCVNTPATAVDIRTKPQAAEEKSSAEQPHNAEDATRNSATPTSLDYYEFAPPLYNFEVKLLENHSALVTIENIQTLYPINVIWFTEIEERQEVEGSSIIDCNCSHYDCTAGYCPRPHIIIDDLKENTTYTFCSLFYYETTISPFNCLPLHVPHTAQFDPNIWISADNKQFTIGMLCLIFVLSIFFGAVVAYFGIKTYPDLLEGSKNVLVVKKSDQTCYVSTISNADTQSSLFKRPLSDNSLNRKGSNYNSSFSISPTTPSDVSAKNLEREYSVKSTASTCFEDSFITMTIPEADEYEMPKRCNEVGKYLSGQKRCVSNTYAMSPRLPPPLPQRNSSIKPEDTNIVINRFSTKNK